LSKISIEGNSSGTGTFTIASPNSNTNRTLDLPDNSGTIITSGSTGGVSQAMLASNVGATGPAFSATAGALTVSASTWTKIPFSSEQFDTNNNYDPTTNYRFTPTVAGYYYFTIQTFMSVNANRGAVSVYKNGSSTIERLDVGTTINGGASFAANGLLEMNGTTDYVEAYVYQEGTGTTTINTNAALTLFSGFLARAN